MRAYGAARRWWKTCIICTEDGRLTCVSVRVQFMTAHTRQMSMAMPTCAPVSRGVYSGHPTGSSQRLDKSQQAATKLAKP